MMLTALREMANDGVLRPLDYHFARQITVSDSDPLVLLAVALTSYAFGQGHTCLDLGSPNTAQTVTQLAAQYDLSCPPPTQWQGVLQASCAIGDGAAATPLVFNRSKLYLMRSWQAEQAIARRFNHIEVLARDGAKVRAIIDRLFTEKADAQEINWQKIAVGVAVSRRLSLISGGPGTGKTTTVTRLLALLVELSVDDSRAPPPLIRLTAPTGKAAARLTESIGQARDKINSRSEVRAAIPTQATTLHQLLGVIPGRPEFRHHRDNPLQLDILVVDEASMIDLFLMSRLLDALPNSVHIIFLGDKDQLASVEAGSVLADICTALDYHYSPQQVEQLRQMTALSLQEYSRECGPAIRDSLCLLRKSYRFAADSGIGLLARAINRGDDEAIKTFCQSRSDDVILVDMGKDSQLAKQEMIKQAVAGYTPYLQALAQGAPLTEVVTLFDCFQVLCAVRRGPCGVEGLNDAISEALQQGGLIKADAPWYPGRPIMISRNDAALGLYNGDIGITFKDEKGALRVALPNPQGSLRVLSPARLPEHETVFAMTVHKSQGSEFNRVMLVLPESDVPVLTRELVYTGVTRAKKSLVVCSDVQQLRRCAARQVERTSGLADFLC